MSIEYSFSRDDEKPAPSYTENGTLDQNERTGFRRVSTSGVGVLQMKLNDTWQALTDPSIINVTRFSVQVVYTESDLPKGSDITNWPPRGPTGGVLRLCQRTATIEIEAEAVHDTQVRRSVGTDVRLRNNLIREGACS
jgi:hypothetical protein